MVLGRVLVIAGSDSSGGAGLEADQKVIAAHGCYAMTATTALTAQNTRGVRGIHTIPASFVREQVDACVEDLGVDVIKTGMLATAETVEMVADAIRDHGIPLVVVDPVMVSTSGHQLLHEQAVHHLVQHLLPRTTILTPNVPEARLLLAEANGADVSSASGAGREISTVADLEAAARAIQAMGPRWVLVKGGHLPFTEDLTRAAQASDQRRRVVDVLVGPDGEKLVIESPWQESTSTHGTGCSLASAIASNLAKGLAVPAAVRAACRYIEAGIRTAPKLGGGHGPLNHFHSTYSLPFTRGYFVEYLLNRPDVADVWKTFVHHPFVMALGNGSLPVESFKGYMVQDYLFLIHFARANSLAGAKTNDVHKITRSTEAVSSILQETKLHIKYCETLGIPLSELQSAQELQACTAYTRYVMDVGQTEDWLALQVALAPCMLGYGAVAKMLYGHAATRRDGNPYWSWIEAYVSEEYLVGVRQLNELLEKYMPEQSPSRIEELIRIFIHATRMEIGFWEMYPHQ